MLTIDRDECIECAFCESICPKKAITPHDQYAYEINSGCVRCQLCKTNCPVNAIEQ